jgi:hypothetical protein
VLATVGFADLEELRVCIVRTWGTAVLCPYTFVVGGAIFYDGLAGEKVRSVLGRLYGLEKPRAGPLNCPI